MKDGIYNEAFEWDTEVIAAVKKCRDIPYRLYPTLHFNSKCRQLSLKPSIACVALKGRIVEAKIKNDQVVKIVTRIRHKWLEDTDVIFAVELYAEQNVAMVKTVWKNRTGDNHTTLQFENY